MNRIALYSIVFFIIIACNSQTFYGDEELGSGYFIWHAGNFVGLVYDDSQIPSSTNAYLVLKESIQKYGFNDTAIVVMTMDSLNLAKYWLIDKTITIEMEKCDDQLSCDKLIRTNVKGPYNQNPLGCCISLHETIGKSKLTELPPDGADMRWRP